MAVLVEFITESWLVPRRLLTRWDGEERAGREVGVSMLGKS